MWFINVVVVVGVVIASVVYGTATYFELAGGRSEIVGIANPPLPMPRPSFKTAGDNYVEDNTVREPKPKDLGRKQRRTKLSSRRERW